MDLTDKGLTTIEYALTIALTRLKELDKEHSRALYDDDIAAIEAARCLIKGEKIKRIKEKHGSKMHNAVRCR